MTMKPSLGLLALALLVSGCQGGGGQPAYGYSGGGYGYPSSYGYGGYGGYGGYAASPRYYGRGYGYGPPGGYGGYGQRSWSGVGGQIQRSPAQDNRPPLIGSDGRINPGGYRYR